MLLKKQNFILIMAFVLGFILGDKTSILAGRTSIYILAIVMVAATSGFSFRSWLPLGDALKKFIIATLLSYIVFGISLIGFSRLIFPGTDNYLLWLGFVVIASSPPGPSVIPFSSMLKGNLNFTIIGVFGAYLAAMVLTPAMLLFFGSKAAVSPLKILEILVELIIIPLIISRMLRGKAVYPWVEKHRGKVINWGFFLVIMPIIGINRDVFFLYPVLLAKISIVFIVCMFLLSVIYVFIIKKAGIRRDLAISTSLLMVIKSSAFAAVTAMVFYGKTVAMPAAVLSVFVLIFLLTFDKIAARIYNL